MHIGVISDTHDRLPTLDRGLAILPARRRNHRPPRRRDCPVRRQTAAGLDRAAAHHLRQQRRRAPGLKAVLAQIKDGPLWFEADNRRILVHHFVDWCVPADIARADIIITGHTHEVVNVQKSGKLFLNSGECCGWVHGRCTVAVLDTRSLSAEIIEVPQ